MLARGALGAELIRSLAATAAAFHESAARVGASIRFGEWELLNEEMLENFEVLDRLRSRELEPGTLERLREWSERNLEGLRDEVEARRRQGWIRECHGDMHLANMALIAGEPVVFDGIEFNERFRWIDVMSEAAFVVMDLEYRDRADLGRVFLNAYLEHTGDYAGLRVLNHYLAYRALVRAKVAAIRFDQAELCARSRDAAHASVVNHVRLALRYGRDRPRPSLTLTRGVSGSGKSWLTERLVPLSGAIRVRSDVERKRIHRVTSPRGGEEPSSSDLYSPAATERTYARLEKLARTIARAGYPVIVDATFLAREHRQRLLAVARELDLPAHILALHAPAPVLRGRVVERASRGGDVSDATPTVVEAQLERDDPLTPSEAEIAIFVDTGQAIELEALAARLAESGGSDASRDLPGTARRH